MYVKYLLCMIGAALAITPNLHPIRCINFYGLETDRRGFVCDWVHPPEFYLAKLQQTMGLNTVRVPFSHEMVSHNDFIRLDEFVHVASTLKLQVILDWHRTWSSHQGPTPLEGITIQDAIFTFYKLANRFFDDPYVIGFGIFNEYQGSNTTFLNAYHKTVIKYLEHHFPKRYYYFIGCSNWGHDCTGIQYQFEGVDPDRVLVDFHSYFFTYNKSEMSDLSQAIERRLPSTIPIQNTFIGEFGYRNHKQEESEWAEQFLAHVAKRNISSLCFWTIAFSGDTEGIFKDDCNDMFYDKVNILNSFYDKSLRRLRGSAWSWRRF